MKMKPFSCDQCGKAFSKKGGLKIHMEAAHGALPSLMCNICGAALKNEQTLKDHIFRRHKDHQAANIPDEKRNEVGQILSDMLYTKLKYKYLYWFTLAL